jgi:PAS domain S-box-containing protein
VNNRSDAERFTPEHVELMNTLAGFLALTIENATLFSASEDLRTHLENLVESLGAAVLTMNVHQTVTLCNARMLRLLGISGETEVEGRAVSEVLPPSIMRVIGAMVSETMTYNVDVHSEAELESAMFGTIPVEITTSALSNASGSVDGIVVTVADLSIRREIAELRRLDELKSSFMALVSHELRTPLTSIKGAAHLLKTTMSGGFSPEQSELVGIVHNNTERLTRLVNNLLDMVHIEHQTLAIVKRPENLKGMLESCLRTYAPLAEAKNLSITTELNAVTATVDRDRISQVFAHLLDNAIKFTRPGGSISVKLSENDGRARAVFSDTGCGIPQESQARLFDKFYQDEHPLTRTTGGAGIGLYIARGIVDLHGGSIRLDSRRDIGTEFTVELPILASAKS